MQGKILTLDVGNTTVDVCLWEGNELIKRDKIPHGKVSSLTGSYEKVLCVSVKPSLRGLLTQTFGEIRFLTLEDIPIGIDYRTKESLGIDRVINAFGVREIYSDSAVVVSCGTAVVVDLLEKGVFKGGFITAGVSLKLKALSQSTEGIPLLKPKSLEVNYGRTTEEAVLGGVIGEVKALIERCKKVWNLEETIITGGEGKLFEDLGIYDELLTHRAMLKLI